MLVTDHGCAGLRPGENTGQPSKLDNWLLGGEVEISDNKYRKYNIPNSISINLLKATYPVSCIIPVIYSCTVVMLLNVGV